MVAGEGIEPSTFGLGDQQATTAPPCYIKLNILLELPLTLIYLLNYSATMRINLS